MKGDSREPVDYKVLILHERPEFGEGVEFLATYYARETKDVKSIEESFRKAFSMAHPSSGSVQQ